jgi:O-antigen/teichoic acid export membrane protein
MASRMEDFAQKPDNSGGNLHVNSLLLMLSSITNALFGFLFWMIAARLYPQSEIGIASGFISALTLGFTFSKLGLDQSLVKFFPQGDKKSILITSIIVVSISSLFIGLILLALSQYWLSQGQFSPEIGIAFILFLVMVSIAYIFGRSFIAIRKVGHFFIQTLFVNSKILFILMLTSFAYLIAVIFSVFFLIRLLGPGKSKFDRIYLQKSLRFSLGTYLYGFLMLLPMQILPLIALNRIGAEEAAIYYLVYTFMSLLFVVPDAFGTTLFVEGSHGRSLSHLYRKSIITVICLLAIAVTIFCIFGDSILGIIGEEYIAGFQLMKIMSLSSFLVAVVIIYNSYLMIKGRMKTLVFLSALISIIHILTAFLLVGSLGILGLGYSWPICYSIIGVIICLLVINERRSSFRVKG